MHAGPAKEENSDCHVRVRARDRAALTALAHEISRRFRVRATHGDAVHRLLALASAAGEAFWRDPPEPATRDRIEGRSAPADPRGGGRAR